MDVRGPELYPTSPALTRAFLREVALPPNVWEPAAGIGHMALPLVEHGYNVRCSDLIDYGARLPGVPEISIVDFMSPEVAKVRLGEEWAIVTNPPFSLGADFVRRGLEICPTVCVLNRLAFLESRARADILDQHLSCVYVFVNRPPMMHRWSQDPETGDWREWQGRKADSAMPFAWYVFTQQPPVQTTLRRIAWSSDDNRI